MSNTMTRSNRWPVAVACLGLGVVGGWAVDGRLAGQPLPVLPPPVPVAPAAPRDATTFAPVVKRVVPAVVSVEGRLKPQPPRPAGPVPPGGRWTGQQPQALNIVPTVEPGADPGPGFGSGFLVDPAGVVLTNNHVVEDVDTVDVTLADGRKFVSKDIRRDPKTDLAVIKLTADAPLPFVEFGDSDAAEVGDRVLAVGAPFGLTGSVTHGIVSAKSRHNLKLNQYEDFVQTDAAINPGNSGGPLVDMDGRVIGITSAIKTRSGGFQGVGLAISSNLARTVSAQLLKDGVVRRGQLGVGTRDLDAPTAAKAGVPVTGGVLLSRVADGGPAAKAGLQAGDVVTAVAGKPVRDGRELSRVVAGLPLGQPAEVSVMRAGQPVVAAVTVEEPTAGGGVVVAANKVPAAPPANAGPASAVQLPDVGLVLADLSPTLAAQLKFPAGQTGVAVLRVTPTSVAARAGLVRGAAVVRVDKTPVATVKDFQQALANADPAKGALLSVTRPNGEVEYVILRVQ